MRGQQDDARPPIGPDAVCAAWQRGAAHQLADAVQSSNGSNMFALHEVLILMDITTSVMDGMQAVHAIRTLLDRSAVPILSITANAFAADRDRRLAAGMN